MTDTAIEAMTATQRVKLEFGDALRQIAQVLRHDVVGGLSMFKMIEGALETRVHVLVTLAEQRAYRDGYDRGRAEVEREMHDRGVFQR